MAESSTTIHVVKATKDGKGSGAKRGKGYPRVLVSGEIDRDPETNAYVRFSSDTPPVWQRPQDHDRNIWWINSDAPLARLYLDNNRGFGYRSSEWRMYHLERHMEIIAQIALTYDQTLDGPMTLDEWILSLGGKISEIQAKAAQDLEGFIREGDLPTH